MKGRHEKTREHRNLKTTVPVIAQQHRYGKTRAIAENLNDMKPKKYKKDGETRR